MILTLRNINFNKKLAMPKKNDEYFDVLNEYLNTRGSQHGLPVLAVSFSFVLSFSLGDYIPWKFSWLRRWIILKAVWRNVSIVPARFTDSLDQAKPLATTHRVTIGFGRPIEFHMPSFALPNGMHDDIATFVARMLR